MVAVEDQHVANFSADVSVVDEWLATRGVPFIPATSTIAVDLEYALLGNATSIHDPKGYIYNNVLDAQIEAIRSTMNAMKFGNQTIEITVSESGWPSKGAPGDAAAPPDNAKKYKTRGWKWLCFPVSCVTYATNAKGTSFSEVVAAQLTPKVVAAQLTPKTVASTPIRRETVAKLKVAINGFGRIGRNFLRCWHGLKDSPLDVVVVNDSGGVKNASPLLKFDSMLGTFKPEVKFVDYTTISVDGKPIKVVSNRDPLKFPWADLGIDIVIAGRGVFVDGRGAGKHIQAGAKKVTSLLQQKAQTFQLMLLESTKVTTLTRSQIS
ncbi:hypothetical protein SLEP1_g41968 [Rubroshorea leprosula]|uniref:glucan endo-1,3-beta-D-glucosidase n=1 Tax=Rubroshorea leprosula TaxID=152421 RepID=A0AAV5L878_9ROSI|nr:hypothetical protein SLEP1_g41968 [Rubroshorea leprosula]